MAQEQTPIEKQEYDGTGRVTGALGTAAIPAMIAVAANKMEGKPAKVTAAVAAIVAGYGAYKGWNNAADGKEQFEKSQATISTIRDQNAQLGQQRDEAVGQLSHAAKILQERTARAQPSVSTSPVSWGSESSMAEAHKPKPTAHAEHVEAGSAHVAHADKQHLDVHTDHAAKLAAQGHGGHKTHAEHAVASKEQANQAHGVA